MANATLVYFSTENLHTTSIAFTSPTKPIFKSPRRKHLLLKTRSLRLLTLKITRKPWKWKEFQAMQQKLVAISMSSISGSIPGYESA